MKKLLQRAVLVALLAVAWTANAHTLTLANGTQTNSTVPVYGTFCNVPTLHHQMLYTADYIASAVTTIDMTNGSISALTFYSSTNNVGWGNTYEIRLLEVSATALGNSGFIDTTGVRIAYTGRVGIENGTMTITLDRSYTYHGGNLLIDFNSIAPGEWFSGSSAFFYGVNTSTLSSRYYYVSSSGSASGQSMAFLPKVTFTFSGGTPVPCPSVSSHSVGTIDSNSAVINWVDNINTGASHTVTYWPEGASSGDTLTTTVDTGSSATLTGLEANTVYHYTVHVVCSDTNQSVALGGSFRTACGTMPIPFSENFDSYENGIFLPCWKRPLNNGIAPRIATIFRRSGAQSMYLQATNDTLLFFPRSSVPLAGDNIYISYWAYLTSDTLDMDTWIKVGVMTDTTNISTFIPLDSIGYHDFNGRFEHYTANTSHLNPTARYWVAWMFYGRYYNNSVYYRGAIDDIYIDDLSLVSDCQSIQNLAADTVVADSVYLHWTPGNNEAGWAVRVNGGAWIDVNHPSYVFAGLSPSTYYTFDVVALCGDTSAIRSLTVRTRCADYLNAPYEADFAHIDAASKLPWCWSRLQVSTSSGTVFPYVSGGTMTFRAGGGSVSSVVLPRVDNLATNAINVEVNGYVSSNNAKLLFGYVTHPDSANSFVALDSVTALAAHNYEFNTSTVENVDSLWLAFRCITAAGNVEAYINSLRINRYSSCERPYAVVLDTVTYNSVGLSWHSTGALAYQIAVSTATDVTVASEDDIYASDAGVDTVKVISDLAPSTHYNTWVRSVCDGDTSEWRQGPSFTTYCGPDYCEITVSAVDGYYGYGVYWGNCGIQVFIDDEYYGKVGMEEARHYPYPETLNIPVCPTQHVVCIGHASSGDNWFGDYNGYVTLTVLDGGGEVIYTANCNDVTDGSVIADLTDPCPSCMPVAAVTVDKNATTANSVTIHWTPGDAEDEMWAVMVGDSVVSATVTDTTFTFTGLTANTLYTFGVATACAPDNISYYTTVASGTDCADVACDIYVSLDGVFYSGAYFNAWYYCDIAAEVYQNGIKKARLTVPHGYNNKMTTPVTVCGGDSVQLVYREGSLTHTYALNLPLAEYVVVNGNGDTMGSGVGMDNYADGDVFLRGVTACPNCITPANVQLVDVTTTSVTLGWTDVTPATAWQVLVSDGSTTDSHIVTTNPCTLTGLQPATVYNFSLAAICDTVTGDTSNYSTPLSVTTECSPLTLPWDYNVYTDMIGVNGRMPRCWYAVESWSNNTNTYPYGIRMDYNTSGYIYLYVNGSYNNGNRVMAATPRIPEAGNNLYVTFHAQGSDVSLAQAGVVTDVNDPTTFIPILTVPGTEGDYEFFTEGIAGLTANDTVHIAFRNQLVPDGASAGNFYVHRVHVQRAPDCHRPDSVVVSNITASGATLTWPNTGATRYEVTVGGTVHSVTTNTITLTGLTPGTNYPFSLVGICSDTSIALYGGFTTVCSTVITLPYSEGFENYADYSAPNCWMRKNLSADNDGYLTPYVINSHAHSGAGSLGFQTSTMHPMTITPALTGTFLNNLYVSFWVSGGSSLGFTAGFMTDPDDDSSFIPVVDVYSTSNSYTQYTVFTDSIATVSTIYYFAIRFNNNSGNTGSIYVDDLVIRAIPDCSEDFVDVHVGDVTSDSVTVHFIPGLGRNVGATYSVSVTDTTGTVVATATGAASPVIVSGLTGSTPYTATVSIICSGSVIATSDAVTFTTRCAYGTRLVIEDSSSVNSTYLPINSLYKHSASQQIYYASELGPAADITSVAFNYNSTTSSPLHGFSSKIYMAHTTLTTMAGGWIDPATMELVYEGYLDCQEGWNEFRFDTAFAYNGIDNVVLMVIADSTGIVSGRRFKVHEVCENISIRFSSDNNPFIYGAMTTTYFFARFRNDVIFYACGPGPCEQPIFVDSVVNETDVTVSYSGDAESYEMAIVPGTPADFEAAIEAMTPVTVSDTVHTFTGLTDRTMYTIGVRSVCNTVFSPWATMTVTTLRHPCYQPTAVTVTGQTYESAVVSWAVGEVETAWEVNVHSNSPYYDTNYIVHGTPTLMVDGLDDGTTYNVTVRALCFSDWYSDWTAPVALITVSCQTVSGVTSSNVTANSATINWISTGVGRYEVDYGTRDFQTGTGTMVSTTTNSITLTGLDAQTIYDVYIRAYCTETVHSGWSTKHQFTTAAGSTGIADVENGLVTLFPNPASSVVTIAGLEGESIVTVVDLNGREVFKGHATGSLTLDVTGYAKGAYFVRVTGESTTAIRKLIVR